MYYDAEPRVDSRHARNAINDAAREAAEFGKAALRARQSGELRMLESANRARNRLTIEYERLVVLHHDFPAEYVEKAKVAMKNAKDLLHANPPFDTRMPELPALPSTNGASEGMDDGASTMIVRPSACTESASNYESSSLSELNDTEMMWVDDVLPSVRAGASGNPKPSIDVRLQDCGIRVTLVPPLPVPSSGTGPSLSERIIEIPAACAMGPEKELSVKNPGLGSGRRAIVVSPERAGTGIFKDVQTKSMEVDETRPKTIEPAVRSKVPPPKNNETGNRKKGIMKPTKTAPTKPTGAGKPPPEATEHDRLQREAVTEGYVRWLLDAEAEKRELDRANEQRKADVDRVVMERMKNVNDLLEGNESDLTENDMEALAGLVNVTVDDNEFEARNANDNRKEGNDRNREFPPLPTYAQAANPFRRQHSPPPPTRPARSTTIRSTNQTHDQIISDSPTAQPPPPSSEVRMESSKSATKTATQRAEGMTRPFGTSPHSQWTSPQYDATMPVSGAPRTPTPAFLDHLDAAPLATSSHEKEINQTFVIPSTSTSSHAQSRIPTPAAPPMQMTPPLAPWSCPSPMVNCQNAMNQQMNQPMNHLTNQQMNQPMDQPMNHPINHPMNHPRNHPFNQPPMTQPFMTQPLTQPLMTYPILTNPTTSNQIYNYTVQPSLQTSPVSAFHPISPQPSQPSPPPVQQQQPQQPQQQPAPQQLQNTIQEDLLRVSAQSLQRDMMVSARPPKDKRFSGDDRSVDFEAFINRFEMVTADKALTDSMRFLELTHWCTGSALQVVSMYELESDPSVALKQAKAHLRKDYGRQNSSATMM